MSKNRKYDEQTEQQIVNDRKAGMTIKMIGEKYGCNKMFVQRLMKKYSQSEGNINAGNVKDGNVPQGNISEGNVTVGNIKESNIKESNVTFGNIKGNVSEGNVSDGNIKKGNVTSTKELSSLVEDVKKAKEKLIAQMELTEQINEIIFKNCGYNEDLAKEAERLKERINSIKTELPTEIKEHRGIKEYYETQEINVTPEIKEPPIAEPVISEKDKQIRKLEKEIADIKELMFESDIPNKMPPPERLKHLEKWNPDWPAPVDTEWLPFQLHKKTEELKRLKESRTELEQEKETEEEQKPVPFHLLPLEERLEKLKTMTAAEIKEIPDYEPQTPEEIDIVFAAIFMPNL